jgi:hypothetical protein
MDGAVVRFIATRGYTVRRKYQHFASIFPFGSKGGKVLRQRLNSFQAHNSYPESYQSRQRYANRQARAVYLVFQQVLKHPVIFLRISVMMNHT